jgi:hypothetical protein
MGQLIRTTFKTEPPSTSTYLNGFFMHTLLDGVFTGKWRSFKIFKQSGGIRLHTDKHFQEFEFNGNRELTIKTYDGSIIEKLVQTDQWVIEFRNKKHYLSIIPELLYEVITVNHTVMVLADMVSQEKIFLTKEAYWQEHLSTNHTVLL